MKRILLALALVVPVAAKAQFPDRPITIVLPYAPGSASDSYGRALGEHFTRMMGQPVVVTNRDGGSGVVGMRFVAQSAPDGYTLGLTPVTPVVVQPHMVRNLGIGPDSFQPVCGTNENVLGVLVREDSPIRNLADLVAEGRRRPLTYGSPGPNSLPQLGVFRIQRATGVEFTPCSVPRRPAASERADGRAARFLIGRRRLGERADRWQQAAADRGVLGAPPSGLPGRADRARAGHRCAAT